MAKGAPSSVCNTCDKGHKRKVAEGLFTSAGKSSGRGLRYVLRHNCHSGLLLKNTTVPHMFLLFRGVMRAYSFFLMQKGSCYDLKSG